MNFLMEELRTTVGLTETSEAEQVAAIKTVVDEAKKTLNLSTISFDAVGDVDQMTLQSGNADGIKVTILQMLLKIKYCS